MAKSTQTPSLAELLLDRDTPCEHCGYNLRGCPDPYCPECGIVIPWPEDEHPQQALHCPACGYELGLAPLERCPECGSDEITLGKGKLHRKPQHLYLGPLRIRLPTARSWKGVPLLIWESAALSLLFTGGTAFQITWIVTIGQVLLLLCVAAPALAAIAWFAMRLTINHSPQRTRTRLIAVVLLGTWALAIMAYTLVI